MNPEMISVSGLALMFVLGLRHGLDPDHIACIDNLTWRAMDGSCIADHANPSAHHARHYSGGQRNGSPLRSEMAPWVGTLFALGHGLLVTAIAVGVNHFSRLFQVPNGVVSVCSWVPTALLVLVGMLNLQQLRTGDAAYRPSGWKMRLLPQRLREHNSPLAIITIGVLFATVFDTATQASAWGYVAASEGGMLAAAAAGLIFTAGMIITDTADGRLLCHVIRRAGSGELSRRYRRGLGWLIVALSFGVAGYNVLKQFVPAIELDERAYSFVGAALLATVALLWVWVWVNRAR